MAILQNQGTVSFTPAGGTATSVASNITNTEVEVTYGLTISHSASPETYTKGDTIQYTTVLRNTGTGSYYNPTITVDLGGGALSYVSGSAVAYLDTGDALISLPVTVTTATRAAGDVTFSFGNTVLPGGGRIILIYDAIANGNGTITSTATGSGAEGSLTGPVDTVTDTAVITETPLSVVKSAPTTADVGDTISYTFTITNNSGVAVTLNGVSDQLPAEFNLTGATLTVNGTPVTLTAGVDYTVTADNLFTLDPQATVSIPVGGTAILTLTGTVSA